MSKSILSFALCSVLLAISMHGRSQKTIMDPNAQVRQVGAFEAINISGAFDVILSQSNETVVVVSASEPSIRDLITTEVKGNTLYLGYKKSNFNFRSNRKLKAYISVPNITLIDLAGASEMRVDGVLKMENLSINLSGASDFTGTIESKDLKLSSSGSSDFKLSGMVDNLKLLVSGSSDISAFGLTANYCDITVSGSSAIEITVEKEMMVSISGSSDITYQGNGVITKQNLSGKSTITKKD
jgi:hypothetical protein